MERKFDAFISYRHHPVDSAIASAVQKQLEHFTIPRAVQKKTGKKRIGNIFRDKEELPVTSDLNDNIGLALSNSEHLIVICSPRTKESIWVQKEIETFLKTHSRESVLTVLAEGEPGDVLPELLLSEEITIIDEDGNEVKTVIPREPLSCDYRMGIRKAKSVELLRLAASILGCPFDDLKQRMHQYRMRRLTAIFSVVLSAMLIFSGYVLWSSGKIKENYDLAQRNYELAQENYEEAQRNYDESQKNLRESQRKQSLQLASYAEDLLAGGNRTIALQLALSALPDKDKNRPYVAEAEYALQQALYTYRIKNEPRAIVTLPFKSRNAISQEHHRYLYYENNGLTFMDSETGVQLKTITFASAINQVEVSDNGGCVLVNSGSSFLNDDAQATACYTLSDGSLLWSKTEDYQPLSLSEDGLRALCFRNTREAFALCVLDVTTGDILKTYETNTYTSAASFTSKKAVWVEDEYLATVDYSHRSVQITNLQTLEITETPLPDYDSATYLTLLPDQSILAYGYKTDRGRGDYTNRNVEFRESDGYIYQFTDIGEAYMTMVKIDAAGSECWTYTLPFVQQIGNFTADTLSRADSEAADRDTVICYIANKYAVLDAMTGEEIHSGEIPGIICGTYANLSAASSRFITEDGLAGSITPVKKDFLAIRYFPANCYGYAVSADRQNIYMRSGTSNNLIHYAFYDDPRSTKWEDTLHNISTRMFLYKNYAVQHSYDDNYIIIDLANHKISAAITAPNYTNELGVTKDGFFLYTYHDSATYQNYVGIINVTTGEQGEPFETPCYPSGIALLDTGKVLVTDGQKTFLCDVLTGEVEESDHVVPGNFIFNHAGTEYVFTKNNALYLHTSDGEDVELESVIATLDTNLEFPLEFSNDDSMLCYSLNNTVYLWDCRRKEQKYTLPSVSGKMVKTTFFDEGKYLYSVTSDGTLLIYETAEGKLLNSFRQIFASSSNYSALRVDYTPDGQIAVYFARQLFFIDSESLQIRQEADNVLLYSKNLDEIVQLSLTSGSNYSLNSFHHYTTEELMEHAHEALGNITLSDEQKKMYGLD